MKPANNFFGRDGMKCFACAVTIFGFVVLGIFVWVTSTVFLP